MQFPCHLPGPSPPAPAPAMLRPFPKMHFWTRKSLRGPKCHKSLPHNKCPVFGYQRPGTNGFYAGTNGFYAGTENVNLILRLHTVRDIAPDRTQILAQTNFQIFSGEGPICGRYGLREGPPASLGARPASRTRGPPRRLRNNPATRIAMHSSKPANPQPANPRKSFSRNSFRDSLPRLERGRMDMHRAGWPVRWLANLLRRRALGSPSRLRPDCA
jgi:hypothetical protein